MQKSPKKSCENSLKKCEKIKIIYKKNFVKKFLSKNEIFFIDCCKNNSVKLQKFQKTLIFSAAVLYIYFTLH